MYCEIAGCYHHSVAKSTSLCKEHEIDLLYWQARQSEVGGNQSIRTYIHEKNKELLG